MFQARIALGTHLSCRRPDYFRSTSRPLADSRCPGNAGSENLSPLFRHRRQISSLVAPATDLSFEWTDMWARNLHWKDEWVQRRRLRPEPESRSSWKLQSRTPDWAGRRTGSVRSNPRSAGRSTWPGSRDTRSAGRR